MQSKTHSIKAFQRSAAELYDAEPLISIEGADEIIDYYNEPEPRDHHRWVLVRKDDGTRIGTCGFHLWDREKKCCDIRYDLYPDYWSKEYMCESLFAIIDFAINEMDVRSINACIYSENVKLYELCKIPCAFFSLAV